MFGKKEMPSPETAGEGASDTTATTASSEGLEVIQIDDLTGFEGGEGIGGGEGSIEPEAGDGYMTKDQFFAMWSGAFGVAGVMTRLQSLPIDKSDPAARPAFDALYDTCRDIPSLRFLVQLENVWFERASVIAAFALPKAAMIAAELKERQAARRPAGRSTDDEPGDGPIDWVEPDEPQGEAAEATVS